MEKDLSFERVEVGFKIEVNTSEWHPQKESIGSTKVDLTRMGDLKKME